VVDYLFATKQRHRIHLVIVPANEASRHLAEKCGFVLEGTVRGAFFNDGRNHDVLLTLAAADRSAALGHVDPVRSVRGA
jgi:RimJ/RimL family protein N-acetyltransferase